MATLPEQAIDAVNEVYGEHPGQRAVHARGVVLKGTFTATPEAARLTRAVHMQGDPVPVTVRFSNGSGDPNTPDRAQDARGMATKFYLSDDSRTDIVAITLPSFFVRRPEDFVEFTRAGKPLPLIGQPGPRFGWFLARHREAMPAVVGFSRLKPPAGYDRLRYNGLHAFKWIGADGGERFVRYSWLPLAGEATLSRGEARERIPDYLTQELVERIAHEPVRFSLELQLAAPGDPTDDPTAAWPKDRPTVAAGTLELNALETGRDTGGDVLVFDPTRVTDGIEMSDDPILRFRSPAYSVSIERRSGVSRPAELDQTG